MPTGRVPVGGLWPPRRSEFCNGRMDVDPRLRPHQAPALRRVTAARDIGLIALLVVLFDAALPFSLIAGMPAVGGV